MRPSRARGFSLIELLISVAITLVVMAIVFQLSRQIEAVYRAEARAVERSSGVIRALDEVASEIARAGYGLEEGAGRLLPCLSGEGSSSDCVIVRSNPQAVSARLLASPEPGGLAVPVSDGTGFETGDDVVVLDGSGAVERARVAGASSSSLRLFSLEGPGGEFKQAFSAATEARVSKVREVRFRHDPESGRLLKIEGDRESVLSSYVARFDVEYLDEEEGILAPAKVASGLKVAAVRVRLEMVKDENAPVRSLPLTLTTAIDMDQQSVSIDFEDRVPGLRLSRVFYPIEHPVSALARPASPTGVIVAAGANPYREPASVFSFSLQRSATLQDRENVVFLDDVRRPVTAALGPERGPLAGSLFVAAWGLRRGHLTRVLPDKSGAFSSESRAQTFDGTEALAMPGGMSFALDNNLYLTSEENGGIFRIRFDDRGRPRGTPEEVGRVRGSAGALTLGADGSLYFVVSRGSDGFLFKLPFDETLAPGVPVEMAPLPGKALSLAADPLTPFLYALVSDGRGDAAVLEISPSFLRNPVDPLREVFRWSRWLEEREQGVEGRLPLPAAPAFLPDEAVPKLVDFLSFDPTGSLYLGASEERTLLKFDFNRPDVAERYAAGVASVTGGDGSASSVRLNTWRKSLLP